MLNWNDSAKALRCVESLRCSRYPNLVILVVDNGSRPEEVGLLVKELPASCHLLLNPTNAGFAEGNNVGARFAIARGADCILVLNNDVVVAPDAIGRLVDVAFGDKRIGVVSPMILLAETHRVVFPRLVHRLPPLLYFFLGSFPGMELFPTKSRNLITRLGTFDGCCFLIRRSAIARMNLFDPVYFFGGYETIDLSMDLAASGIQVVGATDARVWAERGDRRRSALSYSYWSPRNRTIFARKHLGAAQFLTFLLLLPLYVAGWVMSWGLVGARSLAVVPRVVAGMWDGFRERVDCTSSGVR